MKAVLWLSSSIPWLFLFLLWSFFISTAIEYGKAPTYGSPDPSNAFAQPLYYATILMIPTLIPAVIGWLTSFITLVIKKHGQITVPAAVGVFGFVMVLCHILFDPMGILNWFFD